MAKKYRLTGCAKFFFVLLILVPIAFFAAAYFTGENPVDKINDTISGGDGQPYKIKVKSNNKSESSSETLKLQKLIDKQEAEIERLKRDLSNCQNAQ